tara:strand:- start:272 stop:442 length:171 start_codon:yes stop_codon:yes gene_type:complete
MFGFALGAAILIVSIWGIFWYALYDLGKLELHIEITSEDIDNSFIENGKRAWVDRK